MASTSLYVQRLRELRQVTHVAKRGVPEVGGHGVGNTAKMEERR